MFTFLSLITPLQCGQPTLLCSGKSSVLDLAPHTPHIKKGASCTCLWNFTLIHTLDLVFINLKLNSPHILLRDLYFFAHDLELCLHVTVEINTVQSQGLRGASSNFVLVKGFASDFYY